MSIPKPTNVNNKSMEVIWDLKEGRRIVAKIIQTKQGRNCWHLMLNNAEDGGYGTTFWRHVGNYWPDDQYDETLNAFRDEAERHYQKEIAQKEQSAQERVQQWVEESVG